MRNRLQAEALGFQLTADAKEQQRQREREDEEKLNKLLKYQGEASGEQQQQMRMAVREEFKEEEGNDGDEQFNPNLIPLGSCGTEEKVEMKYVRETERETHSVNE